MKKIINESTLKKIIAESLKEYLNEIGNTPEGFLAIKNAQAKALRKGRYDQEAKFKNYAEDIDGGTLVSANNEKILWQTKNFGERACITASDAQIERYSMGDNKWNFIGNLTKPVDGYTLNNIKTDDKKTARQIALWVQKYLPNADEMYKDWHTWAAL